MGDDSSGFGNVELKSSMTSCQDILEKVGYRGF